MRKLLFIIAGACALFIGSANMTEAQAQPRHGYGYDHGYRRPPPPPRYAPPPRRWAPPRAYRPRCFTRSARVWNGYRWVVRPQRICR